jgi:hypothetical protein
MIAALFLVAASASAQVCDLASLNNARAVHDALGRRAAEIVGAAALPPSERGAHALNALVDPSASFDLGVGDVGRPLGKGLVGVRALVTAMKADQFRFLGWDYMDGPVDACTKQSVTVDFVDTADRRISQVEFVFDQGRLVAAKGWQHSFEGGPMPSPARDPKD